MNVTNRVRSRLYPGISDTKTAVWRVSYNPETGHVSTIKAWNKG